MGNRTLDIHHERRSLRYPGWDYSTPVGYFVTVCTHDREQTLGEICNGKMNLNDLGRIAEAEWVKTREFRRYVEIDEFVIMPNHLHGIIWLIDPPGRGVLQYAPTGGNGMPRSPSVGVSAIVRGWKSATTKRINDARHMPGIPVWQRNFHDRIIRDRNELEAMRTYIRDNPKNWEEDEYAGGRGVLQYAPAAGTIRACQRPCSKA